MSRRHFVGLLAACPLLRACEFVDVFEGEGGQVLFATFDLELEDFAALREVGGTACATAGLLDVILIRINDTEIRAMERRCPHENLDMSPCDGNAQAAIFDPNNQNLICLHHGSVFNMNGQVVGGPSPRDIRVFPTDFDQATGRGAVFVSEEARAQASAGRPQ